MPEESPEVIQCREHDTTTGNRHARKFPDQRDGLIGVENLHQVGAMGCFEGVVLKGQLQCAADAGIQSVVPAEIDILWIDVDANRPGSKLS
jgi:hypothetical protein